MDESSTAMLAYADGSCLGNPGPGGWGVVIVNPDGSTRTLSGANPATTNNRMEMTAAIEALRFSPPGAEVTIRTDSQYVVKTMTLGWKRRENLDLWRQLDDEAEQRRVRWEWVRGHAGDTHNEQADEIARTAAAAAGKTPSRLSTAKSRRASDNDMDRRTADIEPLLLPGETLKPCAACGNTFVSSDDSRYCSLATCQTKARQSTKRQKP
jgi:ribonuclease HI